MQTCAKDMYPTSKNKIAKTRNYQERSVPKFLKKVFQILEENKHSELVSWTNDGLAIVIKKPTEFSEKILPLYFKHSNFASFIRQLNMYKFKKKKNYQYDHVYLHDMFQQGRIDLLRNIQRKVTDNPLLAPMEMKMFKDDVEIDVDNLLQENLYYKRIHKTLSTQVQFIENKMSDLRSEISTLYTEQQQHKANEQFLKRIVKGLTRVYGYQNIERVIEAIDAEETVETSSGNAREQLSRHNSYPENYKKFDNRNKNLHHFAKDCNTPSFDDDDEECSGKECSNICEYEAIRQSSASEAAPIYHKSQMMPMQNGSYNGKGLFAQESEMKNIFMSDDSDDGIDSGNSTSSKTYQGWLKDLEKRKACESLMGQIHNHHIGGLDIEDLYHKTDF